MNWLLRASESASSNSASASTSALCSARTTASAVVAETTALGSSRLMLELLSTRGRKLSELLVPFREQFFLTGEINTPVADVAVKLQELKERYSAEGGRITHLDGISVDFDDWHFNVRPSNTEPLVRLNLEALSHELMEQKRDEVLELLRD